MVFRFIRKFFGVKTMQGERFNPREPHVNKPGDYWQSTLDVHWFGIAPNGLRVWFRHGVEVHADGTISVPTNTYRSNIDAKLPVSWTGSINHGVWKESINETEY
jgi:hypothetical protein